VNMDDTVRRHSVTARDTYDKAGGPVTIMLGPSSWGGILSSGLLEGVKGATGLPAYGTKAADAILSETPLIENMWASAVNTTLSKQVAIGFQITDTTKNTRRIDKAKELMLDFDGSYSLGLSKHVRDFLTTDNGAFIEIVRASNARGSRIVGLAHLDSLRTYRTNDSEYPVVYQDYRGEFHRLRHEEVIILSDMPSPRVEHRGLGMCAARRAFETILKMCAIETYVREKVSGSRNLAIHIVNGITDMQLRDALMSSQESQSQRGYVVYKGSTIIPMLKSENPSVVTIPLAEVPDGFSADSERKDAYLRYANALGVFVGEIQPLSGQGLGTGTQTVVLEEAAEGRGMAAWRRAFTLAMTHHVFPTTTTFTFASNDVRDKKMRMDTLSMASGAIRNFLDTGVLTADQIRNYLVDEEIFPQEFLQFDVTSQSSSNDTSPYIAEEVTPSKPLQIPNAIKKLYRIGPEYEAQGLLPPPKPSAPEAAAALQGEQGNLEVEIPGTETKDDDGNDVPARKVMMPKSIQKLYGYKSADPRKAIQDIIDQFGVEQIRDVLIEELNNAKE
jgi:hypothetical protein